MCVAVAVTPRDAASHACRLSACAPPPPWAAPFSLAAHHRHWAPIPAPVPVRACVRAPGVCVCADGDIIPHNLWEMGFVILMEFVGLIVFGMAIASMTNILSNFNMHRKL